MRTISLAVVLAVASTSVLAAAHSFSGYDSVIGVKPVSSSASVKSKSNAYATDSNRGQSGGSDDSNSASDKTGGAGQQDAPPDSRPADATAPAVTGSLAAMRAKMLADRSTDTPVPAPDAKPAVPSPKQPKQRARRGDTIDALTAQANAANQQQLKDRIRGMFDTNQTLDLASGENRILYISKGNLNRIVTPFNHPMVFSSCQKPECVDFVQDNVVFFGTNSERPIGVFITPQNDPSVAISVTMSANNRTNPQEYRIRLKGYHAKSARAQEDKKKAEKFDDLAAGSYYKWIKDLVVTLVKDDQIPPGYSLSGPDKDMLCRQAGLETVPGQLMDGARYRIEVYRVTNPTSKVQVIQESECHRKGVRFIFAWPNPKLMPHKSAELFVVRHKSQPQFDKRPPLVSENQE